MRRNDRVPDRVRLDLEERHREHREYHRMVQRMDRLRAEAMLHRGWI